MIFQQFFGHFPCLLVADFEEGYNPCLYGGGVGGLVVVAADKVVQRLGKIVKFFHRWLHRLSVSLARVPVTSEGCLGLLRQKTAKS